MSLIDIDTTDRQVNPVDLVENLAALNEWSFDRSGDDEITLSVTGRWADYHASFTWMDDIESLHLACAFDLKVPERRRGEVRELIQLANEQMWLGHFDLWPQEGVVMFRHALLLAGGAEASGRQCEAQLDAAMEACDRYYQAFQFVVWAGKSAREAMDSALFETSGEA
ncbi:MAG: YbjN domain-containing protein [Phreatobacter sp.]|uniref:YbjN domain-containing protein n=1 Tax=Phreatobacter sp. TaxID=1966341 RepID=UPI001A592D34|nr:YbjN domain-containing protein [Phreatobacter sp.]MBL8569700.1 YbjN domain-containing protein [Phreatobacter sp.]MCA0319029.1 YbjN domain-containing protein [Pseudomonadota bacterium]